MRHRSARRRPWALWHPQRHRHRPGYLRRIPHRGQFRQPHSVGEPASYAPGHLCSQPGLARPPWAGHRYEPALLKQDCHLGHCLSPAYETGQRRREPVYTARHGTCRRVTHSDHDNRAALQAYRLSEADTCAPERCTCSADAAARRPVRNSSSPAAFRSVRHVV